MSVDNDMLKENIIFNGMSSDEIDQALSELCAIEKAYEKNSLILRAGDITDYLGLVLSGSITIESNDMWGNRTILSNVGEGGFFAETYALLENEPLLVDSGQMKTAESSFLRSAV